MIYRLGEGGYSIRNPRFAGPFAGIGGVIVVDAAGIPPVAGVGLVAGAPAGETAAALVIVGTAGHAAGPAMGGRVGTAGSTGWTAAGLVPGNCGTAPAPPGIGPGGTGPG